LTTAAVCTACAASTTSCPLKLTVTACMSGYHLKDGACEKCSNHFATCVSATNGTTCMGGYY
jgi:hypothetical protein